MESRVKRENYILISGWMVKDLHLKGNELIVFAMIYGFSQDGVGTFNGSLQYISDWTNCSKTAVMNVLKSLVLKGYIVKKDKIINNVKYCEYSISEGIQESCIPYKKVDGGIQESCIGYTEKLYRGIQESLPNNINNNTNNNKKKNKINILVINEDFEYLWSLYPKKRGKDKAFTAYKRAIEKGETTKEEVEAGIKAYIAYINKSRTESQYIKNGSTYFNGRCWNDSYDISGVNNNGRFNEYGGISNPNADYRHLDKNII